MTRYAARHNYEVLSGQSWSEWFKVKTGTTRTDLTAVAAVLTFTDSEDVDLDVGTVNTTATPADGYLQLSLTAEEVATIEATGGPAFYALTLDTELFLFGTLEVLPADTGVTIIQPVEVAEGPLRGEIGAVGSELGFYGATPVTKPTVTGTLATTGLKNTLAALASLGLVTNSVTGTAHPSAYPYGETGLSGASYNYFSVASATGSPPAANVYMVRAFVPAGTPITALHTIVHTVGSGTPGAGDSAFGVFVDGLPNVDHALLGRTANDNALFTSQGVRSKALQTPIAAQGTDRWVYLALVHNLPTAPTLCYLEQQMFADDITTAFTKPFQAGYRATASLESAATGSLVGYRDYWVAYS